MAPFFHLTMVQGTVQTSNIWVYNIPYILRFSEFKMTIFSPTHNQRTVPHIERVGVAYDYFAFSKSYKVVPTHNIF